MNTIVILHLHSPVFVVLVITRGGGGRREVVIVPSSMFTTRCELESTTPFPNPSLLLHISTSQLFTGYKPQSTALLQALIIGNEPRQNFTPQ